MEKKYILNALIVFPILISECVAGAWLYEKGQQYNAEGLYYTFPSTSKNGIFLPGIPQATADVVRESTRLASVSEYQYGLTEEQTLKAKIDVGYVRDNYKLNVVSGSNTTQTSYTNEYSSIISEFAYRQEIFRDMEQVFSSSFSFFPGEYILTANESYFISEQTSLEMRLLHGIAFSEDINFGNILGGAGYERYHYFEWQMAARYYPQMGQVQWDFDQHIGVRPADKWLCVFGLYNTFHGASFSKRPHNASDLTKFADSTTLTTSQKAALINGIKATLSQRATYRDHKLNIKLSYEVMPDRHISIESFSNVFIEKPFTNNTVVITYDYKF